eukprot:GHVN01066572.1.p1 GENE.GHVN01066572.1~~GHVN01066572.1.p1  ORF type:complete len:2495 (-),score=513.08 GHVN01066572.1:2542-10026(-)
MDQDNFNRLLEIMGSLDLLLKYVKADDSADRRRGSDSSGSPQFGARDKFRGVPTTTGGLANSYRQTGGYDDNSDYGRDTRNRHASSSDEDDSIHNLGERAASKVSVSRGETKSPLSGSMRSSMMSFKQQEGMSPMALPKDTSRAASVTDIAARADSRSQYSSMMSRRSSGRRHSTDGSRRSSGSRSPRSNGSGSRSGGESSSRRWSRKESNGSLSSGRRSASDQGRKRSHRRTSGGANQTPRTPPHVGDEIVSEVLERIAEFLKMDLKAPIERLKQERRHQGMENSNLQSRLEKAIEDNDQQLDEIKELQEKLQQAEINQRHLSGKVAEFDSKKKELESIKIAFDHVKSERERLLDAKQQLESRLEVLSHHVATDEDERADMEEKMLNLQQVLVERENELVDVHNYVEEKAKMVEDLNKAVAVYRKRDKSGKKKEKSSKGLGATKRDKLSVKMDETLQVPTARQRATSVPLLFAAPDDGDRDDDGEARIRRPRRFRPDTLKAPVAEERRLSLQADLESPLFEELKGTDWDSDFNVGGVENTEDEVFALVERNTELDMKILKLEEEKATQDAEMNALKQERDSLTAAVHQLNQAVDLLSLEADAAQQVEEVVVNKPTLVYSEQMELAECSGDEMEFNEDDLLELEETRERVREVEEELLKLTEEKDSEVSQLKKMEETLSSDIEQKRVKLAEAEAAKAKLTQELNDAVALAASAGGDAAAAAAMQEAMRKKQEEVDSANELAKKRLEAEQTALKQLEELQAKLAQNSDLQRQLDEANELANGMATEFDALMRVEATKLEAAQTELGTVRPALEAAQAVVATVKPQLEATQIELATLKPELQITQTKLEAAIAEVAKKQEEMEAAILREQETTAREAKKQAELEAGAAREAEAQKTAEALLILQKELEKSQELAVKTQQLFNQLATEKDRIVVENQELGARFDEAKTELSDAKVKLATSEHQLNEAHERLVKARQETEEALTKLGSSSQEQMDRLKAELVQAQEAEKVARVEVVEKTTLVNELEFTLTELNNRLDSAEARSIRIEEELATMKKQLEAKLAAAEEKISEYEKDFASAEGQWERDFQISEARSLKAEQRYKDAQKKMGDLLNQLNVYEMGAEQRGLDLKRLMAEREMWEAQIGILEARNKAVEEKSEQHRSMAEELETLLGKKNKELKAIGHDRDMWEKSYYANRNEMKDQFDQKCTQYDDLEAQLKDMEREHMELDNEKKELCETLESTVGELAQMTNENEKNLNRVKVLETDVVTSLVNEKEQLAIEFANAAARADDAELDAKLLKEKMDRIMAEKESWGSHKAETETALKEARDEARKVGKQLKEVQRELSDHENRATRELNKVNDQLERHKIDLSDATQDLTRLRAELEQLQKSELTARQEAEDLDMKVRELESEKELVASQAERDDEAIIQLQEQNFKLGEELEAMNRSGEMMAQALEMNEKTLKEIEDNSVALDSQLREKEAELLKLRQAIAHEMEERGVLGREKAELTGIVHVFKDELRKREQATNDLIQKNKELEIERSGLKHRVETQLRDLDAARMQNKNRDEQLGKSSRESQKRFEELRIDKEEIIKRNSELVLENQRLAAEKAAFLKTQEYLDETQAVARDRELKSMKTDADLKLAQSRCQTLEESLALRLKEVASLQKEKETLKSELSASRKEHAQLVDLTQQLYIDIEKYREASLDVDKQKKGLESQIFERESRIDDLHERLSSLREEKAAEIAELEETVSVYETELDQLRTDATESANLIQDLKASVAKMDALRNQLNKALDDRDALRSLRAEAETRIVEHAKEAEAEKVKTFQLTQVIQEKDRELEKIKVREEDVERKAQALMEGNAIEINDRVAQLLKELAKAKLENATLTQKVEHLTDRNLEITQFRAAEEIQHVDRNKEILERLLRTECTLTESDKLLSQLNNKLKEAEERQSWYKAEMKDIIAHHQEMQARVAALLALNTLVTKGGGDKTSLSRSGTLDDPGYLETHRQASLGSVIATLSESELRQDLNKMVRTVLLNEEGTPMATDSKSSTKKQYPGDPSKPGILASLKAKPIPLTITKQTHRQVEELLNKTKHLDKVLNHLFDSAGRADEASAAMMMRAKEVSVNAATVEELNKKVHQLKKDIKARDDAMGESRKAVQEIDYSAGPKPLSDQIEKFKKDLVSVTALKQQQEQQLSELQQLEYLEQEQRVRALESASDSDRGPNGGLSPTSLGDATKHARVKTSADSPMSEFEADESCSKIALGHKTFCSLNLPAYATTVEWKNEDATFKLRLKQRGRKMAITPDGAKEFTTENVGETPKSLKSLQPSTSDARIPQVVSLATLPRKSPREGATTPGGTLHIRTATAKVASPTGGGNVIRPISHMSTHSLPVSGRKPQENSPAAVTPLATITETVQPKTNPTTPRAQTLNSSRPVLSPTSDETRAPNTGSSHNGLSTTARPKGTRSGVAVPPLPNPAELAKKGPMLNPTPRVPAVVPMQSVRPVVRAVK